MAASFRPDIQGLRALAVGGVVAYHFGLTALPGGFAGVDIFFVISGWLISTHLMQEIGETGRLDLWRFYARRARRLLPAALFVILVTLAAGYFILAPQEQALYSRGAMFASAYAINLWLLRWSFDYFAADATSNPFIHFWSLSVEEQFYLAWPALLLLAAWLRPGRRTAAAMIGVVGLASFAACLWLTSAAPAWAFYFSPLRAWEFAAGGLATLVPMALLQHRIWLRPALGWLGLALIATAYRLLSEDLPFPGWYALLPVAGTVLVLLSGGCGEQTNGRTDRHVLGPATALSLPLLQWIGTLSYSLYLWHWPVIVYAGMLTPDLTVPQRLGCGVLALALSVLTYHLIENPARRGAWLTVGARALAPALALTGAGVAVAYANAHLATRNIGPEQRGIEQAAERPSIARAVDKNCLADFQTVTPKPCTFGPADATRTIVLFGDSHADHWSTPLIEAARRNHTKVVTYLKSSCRASRLSTFNTVLKRDYTECDAWREQAISEIIRRKPRLVVISEFSIGNLTRDLPAAERTAEVARWQAGLRSTLQAFSRAGVETAVIRDTPINASFAGSCVARTLWWREAPSPHCDTPRAEAANDSTAATERAVVTSVPDTRYIDLTNQFCGPTTCHVVISGQLAFRDRHHLATGFAETLAGPLERALF
ncbi:MULTISPECIES: acyltransferase family protein [Mesorhizobium]|uniref:Acyltransferase 3 n=10 Tax=Mesorhizobium TaxID=68287 RepID=E8T9T8_MESCW|nr:MULTISPECIES: acyltransferase family protein [Mesorhizobium]ADV11910.1 acyltransferase 3 [Mesorhizobium ciceri biovar biserrulae WSM1271]RUX72319.1 acyltransferase [Mesorhizobium sp. M7A.F.Ca.US.005.03.1.1]RUY22223.1 acyltransferase [Mesorhizobium sp. M7A.F.Ca.US.001.04.2.1]RVA07371.1 acyltransferase [Mesorhizobium sp. M7A.F.Ca.US.001.02.1.1]